MLIPAFWAEAQAKHRERGRQITVRRFGWSDVSQEDAQSQAQSRADEALRRALAGEKLPRREPKVAYNGAVGTPIREEIVSRHGDAVITRNSYGARCLNTPNVLFADVDLPRGPSFYLLLAVFVVLTISGIVFGLPQQVQSFVWRGAPRSLWQSLFVGSLLLLAAVIVLVVLSISIAEWIHSLVKLREDGPERAAMKSINRFVDRNPSWSLRVYRTPAGLRVLATQQLFTPGDPEVRLFFSAIGTDRVYERMCLNQQCFRARLTPKPWRMGFDQHIRPAGVWPVRPERLEERNAWVADYEAKARAYAACTFLETIGSGLVDPRVRPIVKLHDDICQANVPDLALG